MVKSMKINHPTSEKLGDDESSQEESDLKAVSESETATETESESDSESESKDTECQTTS